MSVSWLVCCDSSRALVSLYVESWPFGTWPVPWLFISTAEWNLLLHRWHVLDMNLPLSSPQSLQHPLSASSPFFAGIISCPFINLAFAASSSPSISGSSILTLWRLKFSDFSKPLLIISNCSKTSSLLPVLSIEIPSISCSFSCCRITLSTSFHSSMMERNSSLAALSVAWRSLGVLPNL